MSKPCIPTTTVREWRVYGAAMKSAGPMKKNPIPQMKNPIIMNPLGPWRTESLRIKAVPNSCSLFRRLTNLSARFPTRRESST